MSAVVGLCCFYLSRGSCKGAPCRFAHIDDDGVSACAFGATCRQGHARRALAAETAGDLEKEEQYWREFRARGAFVGDSPADRDACLLRSQLEPFSTPALRARLVNDMHIDASEIEGAGRGELMTRLLECYEREEFRRTTVRIDGGRPVRPDLLAALRCELEDWAHRHMKNRQERPSIRAEAYMILRSPAEFGSKDGKNAVAAAAKIAENSRLWELATQAITEADPDFAQRFTALAVTLGFEGSPHIDKQNVGPFYGLAIGDFDEGQGGICVESSPFEVAIVNTRHRFGQVDGRFPHWYGFYSSETQLSELIFHHFI